MIEVFYPRADPILPRILHEELQEAIPCFISLSYLPESSQVMVQYEDIVTEAQKDAAALIIEIHTPIDPQDISSGEADTIMEETPDWSWWGVLEAREWWETRVDTPARQEIPATITLTNIRAILVNIQNVLIAMSTMMWAMARMMIALRKKRWPNT